jgi:acetyl-CoA acetyltransferase family protein
LPLGQGQLEDSLWECLTDTFVNMPMAMTAERLAEIYQLSQDEVDNYSLMSQTRYQHALQQGAFLDEITAVDCGSKKGPCIVSDDEHPRKDVSLDKLKNLPKVFKKDGVIHAGAASGIADGAAALVLCSESFLHNRGLHALGEVICHGIVGCDPSIMGIGPVNAINQALQKADLTLADMAFVEVNEAFAPQTLAVKKELGLSLEKLNSDGGAIAIGHPLAASGARIVGHLLHSLKRTKQHLAIGSACIGGGQGIALIVGNV